MGVKAARKREWPPRADPHSESELSDRSVGNPSSESPESSDVDSQGADQPESDAEKSGIADEEGEDEDNSDHDAVKFVHSSRRSFSPPEIEFLEIPPRTERNPTTTPPPPAPERAEPTRARVEPSAEPSEELIIAIEALTLSSVYMQKARRLPFLLRNLRIGFISRCRSLNIPTQPSSERVSVTIRYEYSSATGEHAFETQMEHWVCPCCELHGTFQTREMLTCHLDWDHDKIFSQWNEVDGTAVGMFPSLHRQL
jgi:hypothetical protein